MAIPVLVVDANIHDGKQIQTSLEATGQFRVTLATRAIEALMRFTETKYQVVVIDFGLPDLNGVDLIRQMHGIDDTIHIVAVVDKQENQASELEKLSVKVVLDKSGYLTNLPITLSKFLNLPTPPSIPDLPPPDPKKSKPEPTPEADIQEHQVDIEAERMESAGTEVGSEAALEEESDLIPPWLQDPVQVNEYLSRLGKEHSAYAWLLSKGATPWNFSETITENQAHGIVRLLSEHDEGLQSKGALIRYIRLSGTGNDYLLYATPVVTDINLTLIFSMETPFSVARRQTHKLSRLLATEDPQKSAEEIIPPISKEFIAMGSVEDEPLQPSEWIPGPKIPATSSEPRERLEGTPDVTESPEPASVQAISSVEEQPDQELTPDMPEAPSIQEPPPMPTPEETPVLETVQSASVAHQEPPLESTLGAEVGEEKPEAVLASTPSIKSRPDIPPLPNDWLPKEPKPASHLPFLDSLPEGTQRSEAPDPANIALQEPKYFLPFTAILLPRFPNHKLVGSLANQLETWLKDLCIAWGWRMAKIDIRPEFLRFTLFLSPEVAPAPSVQSLAQNLSTRILQAFPGMADDLPSGQFWTKSYLLTAGSDVGKDRLATFIETTRKEQGLTH